MRRVFAAVGLCLLLALAGCSYLPGSTDQQAPGVEEGQLVDAEALLGAHESALTESGYSHEIRVNQSVPTENGTLQSVRRQRMRVAEGASEYVRQVIYGDSGRLVAWGNESVEYQRIDVGGGLRYQRTSPESATAMAGVKTLGPLLSAPFEVVETESTDGQTLLTLEATGMPSEPKAVPRNATSVDDYEARLVVDGDGRVHRLNASVSYRIDGQTAGYDFAFTLNSTEDPGVERPSWVEDVRQGPQ